MSDQTPNTEASSGPSMAEINAEMVRTAYQKKAVSHLAPGSVLDFAIAFFAERGYRAGRTGRPNQLYVMGPREGILPRVTGEIVARPDVGKTGTTLVTLDATGERLGQTMAEFHQFLRQQRRPTASQVTPSPADSQEQETTLKTDANKPRPDMDAVAQPLDDDQQVAGTDIAGDETNVRTRPGVKRPGIADEIPPQPAEESSGSSSDG